MAMQRTILTPDHPPTHTQSSSYVVLFLLLAAELVPHVVVISLGVFRVIIPLELSRLEG
jgi:hypothetical protein